MDALPTVRLLIYCSSLCYPIKVIPPLCNFFYLMYRDDDSFTL